VAPAAVVVSHQATRDAEAFDTTATLRVEFLQQHLPADTLLFDTTEHPEITLSANNAILFNKREVGTFVTKVKKDVATPKLQFNFGVAGVPVAAVEAVIRCCYFRHGGKRDRQLVKKVQVSLKAKGTFPWSRSTVVLNMAELPIDATAHPAARWALDPTTQGYATSAPLFSIVNLAPSSTFADAKILFMLAGELPAHSTETPVPHGAGGPVLPDPTTACTLAAKESTRTTGLQLVGTPTSGTTSTAVDVFFNKGQVGSLVINADSSCLTLECTSAATRHGVEAFLKSVEVCRRAADNGAVAAPPHVLVSLTISSPQMANDVSCGVHVVPGAASDDALRSDQSSSYGSGVGSIRGTGKGTTRRAPESVRQ
jgi:hypothetical protein